jgi:hypothetical protein
MKKIFASFLTVAAFAAVTTISSCTKTCDEGYEGSDCKTEIRTKFLVNNAVVADGCAGSGYNMSITAKQSAITYIVFSNLGNYSTPAVVEAQVDGNSLSATSFVDAAGRKFTVDGSLSGNTLTVHYTVVYTDNTSETCTATISL